MDIALSIATGLGLRVFLLTGANAGLSNKLAAAVLGLWEGIVLHQVSGRSSAPNVDHFLAYGLRLAVDFLLSRDLQRMIMLVLWTALASVMSEIVLPRSTLRAELKKSREREKERRHRRTRSGPTVADIPIIAVPLPPRVRAYKPPERNQSPPSELLDNPHPQTSTPVFSSDQPPSPPSFFLHATPISPSPKPVYLPTLHSADSSPRDALPVRPRSGLLYILDQSPDSASPLPLPILLPTPPDSAQSAILPADIRVEIYDDESYDNQILGFAPDLDPIPEMSSSDNNSIHVDEARILNPLEDEAEEPMSNIMRVRVPDWLADQVATAEPDALFLKPFSPTASPEAAAPIPVPIPVRRPQSSLWNSDLNDVLQPVLQFGEINLREDVKVEEAVNTGDDRESDSDELQTPGARATMNMETDNEYDPDPLQTPRQLVQEEDCQLSPLVLNVRSSLPDNDMPSNPEPIPEPVQQTPNALEEINDHIQIPGTFFRILNASQDTDDNEHIPGSMFQTIPNATQEDDGEDTQILSSFYQNMLLQPPLPGSGPVFRPVPTPPASPPPASPSTIMSDPSDISVLSTRIPNKLYSRGDELRQKAREEERLRAQLEDERRLAENQGRTLDALRLKIQIKDIDAASTRLHEKAARRYFVGTLSRVPFVRL